MKQTCEYLQTETFFAQITVFLKKKKSSTQ